MKRIVKTQLLVLLIFIIIVAVPHVQAKTWIVDDDGLADFNKIQAAVDAASPGDTISVRSGTYSENVKINKNNLIITSENGPDSTIVQAQLGSIGQDHIFEVSSDYVTITNLKITGARGHGYWLENWYYAAGIGISGTNCIISNNYLVNNENGIYLWIDENHNTITNNQITDNTMNGIMVGNPGTGLYPQSPTTYDSQTTIKNNNISANYDGIKFAGGSNNFVENNNISFNNYDGINLINSKENNIKNNIITNNRHFGIDEILQSYYDRNLNSHNIIIANNVSLNEYGISLTSSTEDIVKDNIILNSGRYGLLLNDVTNTLVDNNIISFGTWGIYLSGQNWPSEYNILSNNIITYQENGIVFWPSCNHNIFYKNSISNNDIGVNFLSTQGSKWHSNNTFYFNNFISNDLNFFHSSTNSVWNSTQPITYSYNGQIFKSYLGNYWSDYSGSDTNENGIGDTSYTITSDEKDNYPLINHFENYVETSSPSAPTLTAPILLSPGEPTSPGPTLDTLTPDFTWSPVSGADKYHIFINDTATGELQTFEVTSSPFTLPAGKLMEGHSYRWNMNSHSPLSTGDIGFGPGWGASNAMRYYFQAPPNNSNGELGAWQYTTPLPNQKVGHSSIVYNNYLYALGGSNAAVFFTPINEDGTLGQWETTTTPLSGFRSASTSEIYKGYIYLIGGNDYFTSYNEIWKAPLNPDGTIGSWSATTPIPKVTTYHSSGIHNGFLYILGGFPWNPYYPSSNYNDVWYAPINPDGTIGSFVAATSLPEGRAYHETIIYGNHIYLVGGGVETLFAHINSDGTLGDWISTTPLPVERGEHTSVVHNGFIYVIGGGGGGETLDKVYYAPINSDGTLGEWKLTTSLLMGLRSHSSATYNGYVYAIGGYDGTLDGSYFTEVEFAKFNDIIEAPSVDSFVVTPLFNPLGQKFTISGTVSAGGGATLQQVELWRNHENPSLEDKWERIIVADITGKASPYAYTFEDTPVSSGDYWYGVHVVDSNTWAHEGGGQDPANGKPIKVTVTPSSEEWKFAVITDLHIGFGYLDYGSDTFIDKLEKSPEEDYFLTKRLENDIKWINDNKNSENIRFVVILGDIADTAERSEFLKAREILNSLNDPNNDGDYSDGIPYIPLIGNHDVGPCTEKAIWPIYFDPDVRLREDEWSSSNNADLYFDEIFWKNNPNNVQKINELFEDSFDRQFTESSQIIATNQMAILQNNVFTYKNIKFISLDLIKREADLGPIELPVGFLHDETKTWLTDHLSSNEPTIILSHIPLYFPLDLLNPKHMYILTGAADEIAKIVDGSNNQILATFSGHNHNNLDFPIENNLAHLPVKTTSSILRESKFSEKTKYREQLLTRLRFLS